jgi:ABC-type transport system involved in multi-copper enzyme maturation permease subunit
VGIALDGSKPLGPGNLTVLPAPVFALMCLGAAMLAILGVETMSLLISVLTTRWAAIGITLAILFAGPVVSGIIALVISLITGSTDSSNFLNYVFFNLLNPVGAVAPAFGNSPSAAGEGMDVFARSVAALAGWTIAFFAAAWLLFHRRQETG